MAETLATGIVVGFGLALMAVGLALIYGVMRSVNFAHGAFYTVGGYAFFLAASLWRVPPVMALLAAPLVGAAMGWVLHWALLRIRPTFARFGYGEYFMIVTFAVAVIIQNGTLLAFGAAYRSPPSLWEGRGIRVMGLVMGPDRLAAVIGAAIAVVVLALFIRLSYTGRSWRALAQNRLGAEVIGVDAGRSGRSAFATAAALGALSGGLLAPLFSVYPGSGVTPLSVSFTIIVLGGMGSIVGALVGGLLVGIVETVGVVYVSSAYAGAYAFALMILVLLIRPTGLFGQRERQRIV